MNQPYLVNVNLYPQPPEFVGPPLPHHLHLERVLDSLSESEADLTKGNEHGQ